MLTLFFVVQQDVAIMTINLISPLVMRENVNFIIQKCEKNLEQIKTKTKNAYASVGKRNLKRKSISIFAC